MYRKYIFMIINLQNNTRDTVTLSWFWEGIYRCTESRTELIGNLGGNTESLFYGNFPTRLVTVQHYRTNIHKLRILSHCNLKHQSLKDYMSALLIDCFHMDYIFAYPHLSAIVQGAEDKLGQTLRTHLKL